MLEKYIIQFNENINGLREFIESIGSFVDQNHKKALEEHNKIATAFDLAVEILDEVEENIKREKENKIRELLNGELIIAESFKHDEGGNSELNKAILVPASITNKVDDMFRAPSRTFKHKDLLYKNSLIGLLSSVEWFYSQVLHYYYDKFPSAAGIKRKSLTLEELKSFGDVNDAEKYLIDNKIEEIFRSGFENWMIVLKEEIGLKITVINEIKDELTEVYQRRNILVHNGGVINSIYYSKVPSSIRGDKKIGDMIEVDEQYMENVICKLHLVFTLIAAELWKKLEPKEDKRGEILNAIAYDNMLKDRWTVVEGLSKFIKSDEETSSSSRTVGYLNYWLSSKKLDKYDTIKKEVEQADYSDKVLRYQLGLLAIKDDKEKFFKILPNTLKSKSLTVYELLEFPIFENIRRTEEFEKFKNTAPEFKELVNFDTEKLDSESSK